MNTISALIAHVATITSHYLQDELTKAGFQALSPSHGFILFQLSQNKTMTMTQLSAKINRDKSTTTSLIHKLESNGYIVRSISLEDKRIRFIQLSEKGLSYTEITQKISNKLINRIYTGFSEQEKQTLFNLLQRVEQNFL